MNGGPLTDEQIEQFTNAILDKMRDEQVSMGYLLYGIPRTKEDYRLKAEYDEALKIFGPNPMGKLYTKLKRKKR